MAEQAKKTVGKKVNAPEASAASAQAGATGTSPSPSPAGNGKEEEGTQVQYSLIDISKINVDKRNHGRVTPHSDTDIKIMADSIKAFRHLGEGLSGTGIITPIEVSLVRNTGRYDIISGYRRVAGSLEAKQQKIPAIIRNMSLSAAVASNTIPAVLSPMDKLNRIKFLEDKGLSRDVICNALGINVSTMNQLTTIAGGTKAIRDSLANGELTQNSAYLACLKLKEVKEEDKREEVADAVISRAKARKEAREAKTKKAVPSSQKFEKKGNKGKKDNDDSGYVGTGKRGRRADPKVIPHQDIHEAMVAQGIAQPLTREAPELLLIARNLQVYEHKDGDAPDTITDKVRNFGSILEGLIRNSLTEEDLILALTLG
jgi:ParB-like chromosome segregation protein Spo0J